MVFLSLTLDALSIKMAPEKLQGHAISSVSFRELYKEDSVGNVICPRNAVKPQFPLVWQMV